MFALFKKKHYLCRQFGVEKTNVENSQVYTFLYLKHYFPGEYDSFGEYFYCLDVFKYHRKCVCYVSNTFVFFLLLKDFT